MQWAVGHLRYIDGTVVRQCNVFYSLEKKTAGVTAHYDPVQDMASLPPTASARTFTGKTISDAEFSEVRGQGGTDRRCLKAQELISGVGQAMTVGTFRPTEWGAVVGLIAH